MRINYCGYTVIKTDFDLIQVFKGAVPSYFFPIAAKYTLAIIHKDLDSYKPRVYLFKFQHLSNSIAFVSRQIDANDCIFFHYTLAMTSAEIYR